MAAAATQAGAEILLTTAGGGREWRNNTVEPLEDRPGYVLWEMEDITARREMEQAMSEEQGRLADLLESVPTGRPLDAIDRPLQTADADKPQPPLPIPTPDSTNICNHRFAGAATGTAEISLISCEPTRNNTT